MISTVIMAPLENKNTNGKDEQTYTRYDQSDRNNSAFSLFPQPRVPDSLALAGNTDNDKQETSNCRYNFAEDMVVHTGVLNDGMKLTKLSES